MNNNIIRWEAQNQEREKQRIKNYKRVIKRFNMNYSSDSSFLEDLSLEVYQEIYEMMFDHATLDEIKSCVESLV